MRYSKSVREIEKDNDPYLVQWAWDTIQDDFIIYNVRNVDTSDNRTLTINEKILLDYQSDGIDKIIAIPGIGATPIVDGKATKGYFSREAGMKIPSYKKLNMQLYHRDIAEPENVHHLSWPWLRNHKTGWEDYLKGIVYTSELLVVAIPKVELNQVMTNPRYNYKFTKNNKKWRLNKFDDRKRMMIKTCFLDMENQRDLDILFEAKAHFYLRNNSGIYVPFHPNINSFKKIEQNYLQHTSRKIKNKL